jgi:hypothetical protein
MIDPHVAVVIITHLWNTDFVHWWHLYFFPVGKPWYEGLVWGNVFAVLPLALGGTIGYWIHKWVTKDIKEFDAKRAHDEHSKHLRAILDALDPDVASGSQLDIIADRVDETTPNGLGTIRDEIRRLQASESTQP